MNDESPVALAAYEALADDFAERAPEKAYNADLERPATRRLLPGVEGTTVLDAGCGPGITTRQLLDDGAARVVGFDVSPRMLDHARQRVDDEATLVRGDLASPLPFEDGAFDLVHAALSFTYVRDWDALFAELARVLRPDGRVVFSTQHPLDDAMRLEPDDYFATEEVAETWHSFGEPVEMRFFRRPLEATITPILSNGFVLENLVEAKPTERFREKDPETYERVSRNPTFLCVRARLA